MANHAQWLKRAEKSTRSPDSPVSRREDDLLKPCNLAKAIYDLMRSPFKSRVLCGRCELTKTARDRERADVTDANTGRGRGGLLPMRIRERGQTTRHVQLSVLAVAAMLVVQGTPSARAQDANRAVEGGGISVPGWVGRIDPKEMAAGEKLSNAKPAKEGDALRVTTGPAVVYWAPDNKASGNYTVKATFRESKYMGLNNHPHPYGIFIAGTEMGTDQQSYLYCAAYGNGNFIVRGFGPAAFQLNGARGAASPAVNKAAGPR